MQSRERKQVSYANHNPDYQVDLDALALAGKDDGPDDADGVKGGPATPTLVADDTRHRIGMTSLSAMV
jgi:hypothetical protein